MLRGRDQALQLGRDTARQVAVCLAERVQLLNARPHFVHRRGRDTAAVCVTWPAWSKMSTALCHGATDAGLHACHFILQQNACLQQMLARWDARSILHRLQGVKCHTSCFHTALLN
jgi:hypothetical protein